MKLVGFVALATGGLIATMVTLHPGGLSSPRWVVYLAASAFVLAGGSALARSYLRTSLAEICVCFMLAAMFSIGLWIAVSPGPRLCTGGFAGVGIAASDTGCRVAFGLGSIVVAVMVLLAVRGWLQRRATG